MTTYTPIDCHYYDQLEAYATLRTWVQISNVHSAHYGYVTRIIDFKLRDHIEYALTIGGEEIRLDEFLDLKTVGVDEHIVARYLAKWVQNEQTFKRQIPVHDTLQSDEVAERLWCLMAEHAELNTLLSGMHRSASIESKSSILLAAKNQELHRISYRLLGRMSIEYFTHSRIYKGGYDLSTLFDRHFERAAMKVAS